MSDIVNVGIQQSGIEDTSPEAISEDGMKLMKTFMAESDRQLVDGSYTLVRAGDAAYAKDYPESANRNI